MLYALLSEKNYFFCPNTDRLTVRIVNELMGLFRGGVQLTVTGQNMNAVQNPIMEVTTIVYNSTANQTYESKLSEVGQLTTRYLQEISF